MARIERDEHRLVERKEDRDLRQDRQTARNRVDALLAIELHHRLLLGLRIVFVALADLGHFRRGGAHLGHGGEGAVVQREQHQLDQKRHDHDGEAVIAQHAVEEVQRREEGPGQEPEHAPVDGHGQAVNAQIVFIGGQDRLFLGAGEDITRGFERGARREGFGVAEIVGLKDRTVGTRDDAELGAHIGLAFGRDGGEPVFGGDAHPAAGAVALDQAFIFPFLELAIEMAAVDDADRAFMEHEEILQVGRDAMLAHQRIGAKGDGRRAIIDDGVVDGEEIVLVHRDRPAEGQVARGVLQHHRRGFGQHIALDQRPVRAQPRQALGRIGAAQPAAGGELIAVKTFRAHQGHRHAGIHFGLVAQQLQVIDPCAGQRQRARQGLGADLDALGAGEGVFTAHAVLAQPGGEAGVGGLGRVVARLLDLGFCRRLLSRFTVSRHRVEDEGLIEEQNADRYDGREQEIAVLTHGRNGPLRF